MTGRRRIYDLRPVRRPERTEEPAVAREAEPVAEAEREHDRLSTLQQSAGNHAVQRQIERGVVPSAGAGISSSLLQVKLAVTPEDDALEHDADRAAHQVLNDEPAAPATAEADVVERKAGAGTTPEVSPQLEQEIGGLRGGGQPLSDSDRAFFEPRFGRDFGDVRVHSDARAANLTRAVDARAFTVGGDIAMAPGEYGTGSGAGRELLAHELAHVVQQDAAPATVQRQPATKSKSKSKPKEQTFDFDEGLEINVDTHSLPKTAQHSGTTEVKSLMEQYSRNLAATQNSLRTGIDDFADFMKFASSKEAKADYAGVAAKFALEQILDTIFEKLGEAGEEGAEAAIPGVGTVWKLTKGLLDKLKEEGERAAKAAGEVAARDFVVKFRDSVNDSFNDAITKDLPKLEEEAATTFDSLGGEAAPSHVTGSDVVTGDAATFLNKLKGVVDGYRVPPATECLRIFTEEWVKQSEGDLMSRGGGDMYYDGRILISWHMGREVEDGTETWSPDAYPTKAELAAPKADKVADAFSRVFKEGASSGAKDINEIDILKVLTIDVEDEVSGFNDHYRVDIRWRSLDDAELTETIPSPVESETLAKAPQIGQTAFNTFKSLKANFGITELEGVEEGRKIASGSRSR